MKTFAAAMLLLPALLHPLCAAEASRAITLVACAPGYPGSSEDAQPTLASFAAEAAKAAGWETGALAAVYINVEEEGLARLAEPDAALALVPLPFYLKHGAALRLEALAAVVQEGGDTEVWSLAAAKGRVTSPGSLEGWEIAALGGYAPAFVRGPVLGGWGKLPAGVRITSTSRILSALRRASQGEDVAVIVDRQQAEAIPVLPFPAPLELVFTAPPVPGVVLCGVAGRLGAEKSGPLVEGLLKIHESEEGSFVLESIQVKRFQVLDRERLSAAETAYGESAE